MAFSELIQKIVTGSALTPEEVAELRDETRAVDEVVALIKKITQTGTGTLLIVDNLRVINGTIVGSKILALAPTVVSEDPTSTDFTGSFMSGSGETFSGQVFNVGGVSVGVLQWGANQTDGKIYFGGGDGWLDEFGLTFANQEGLIQFLDTLGGGTMVIYADGGNSLVLENSFGGKQVAMLVDTAAHTVLEMTFGESADQAEASELRISAVAGGVIILGGVNIWSRVDGKETVFNDDSYDIDHRFEGATDANLVKMDGGTDRVGIGVAAPGYKLHVNGDVNVATGSNFKINGTNIAGSTTEEIQDIAGAMFTGNTETGITATYQDSDGTIDLVVTPAGVGAIPNNGWVEVSDSWSYASATTITIPSDGTTVYNKWMKIRFKQGGAYKYYVCTDLAATLITVMGNDDYQVANSAITEIAYSFAIHPNGYPDDFGLTPVFSNLTIGNGDVKSRVTVLGGQVFFQCNLLWGTTTSISGSVTVTLPVTASTAYAQITPIGVTRYKDATGGNAASGIIFSSGVLAVLNSSGTYALGDALSSTVPFTWTTSDVLAFSCTYFGS